MGIFSFLSQKLSSARGDHKVKGSLYDFKMKSLDGKEIDFSQYKGRNLLIVNTASNCGYTPQYEALQKLHEQAGDKITVLGFPSNNFLWQEPGNNEQIATFCQKNYGVTFQMFEKIAVKGKNRHPLYRWLAGMTGKAPGWNFCKYLVNEDATEVSFYPSQTSPLDRDILGAVNLETLPVTDQ